MKYDRSKIMTEAWSNYRLGRLMSSSYTFSRALALAWHYAKQEANRDQSRYEVVGTRLWNGSERIIATGLDFETASRIKHDNRCQYDNVEVRKIA